jgi:vitamin B12 transport system permease protein
LHTSLNSLRASRPDWRPLALPGLALGLVLLCLVSLNTGTLQLAWSQVLAGQGLDAQVFWQLRLPRTLAAVAIGAGLAVSGAALQVLLGNPLAEPGIIGISAGASLAAVIGLFLAGSLGLAGSWWLPLVAFTGALLTCVLLFLVASWQRLSNSGLLLFGIAIGMLANAGVTWFIYFSDHLQTRQLLFWLMGSLAQLQPVALFWCLPLLGLTVWLCRWHQHLNLLMLGERHAFAAGIDVLRLRRRLIVMVSLISAISVSLAGVIGFVGLVVPHILRLLLSANLRRLLPASALLGALVLVAADLLARSVLEQAELPLGAVTATLGAPVFLYLLVRHHAA